MVKIKKNIMMFHYWNTGNKWEQDFCSKFCILLLLCCENYFKLSNITVKLLVLIKYAVYHLNHHNMSNDDKIIKPESRLYKTAR